MLLSVFLLHLLRDFYTHFTEIKLRGSITLGRITEYNEKKFRTDVVVVHYE